MLSRLGPGPVFVYEWLLSSRRWRTYGQRVLFVGAIWIGLLLIWALNGPIGLRWGEPRTVSIQEMAIIGQTLYSTVVVIELTMLLLVAPAATAGAVCLDKMRGTLEHMLVTDLSSAEIVLGKLAARLAPILGLVAAVLPVMALAGLLGGIDPLALGGSFLVALGCAALACTLALLLSVWGRKPHEVLMLSYLLIFLWMIAPGLLLFFQGMVGGPRHPLPVKLSNPYYLAFAPYTVPGSVDWTTYLGFLGGCLAVSALLAGWATLRVRAVAARQSGVGPVGHTHPRRRGFSLGELVRRLNPIRHLPGPSLDGNPVLWREWHRARPSRTLRIVWRIYSALGALWIAAMVFLMAFRPMSTISGATYSITYQVWLGLLLLSVGASTSLSEERARGSLDLVMSTPLSTRSILAGKWWGAFRQSLHVLIWPTLTGVVLLVFSPLVGLGLLMLGALVWACAALVRRRKASFRQSVSVVILPLAIGAALAVLFLDLAPLVPVFVALLAFVSAFAVTLARRKTYLQDAPLAALSLAIGALLGAGGPRLVDLSRFLAGYAAMLALDSAYCASIVSLGLFTAVRERRPGRAAARCVAIVVALAVGWPFLVVTSQFLVPQNNLGLSGLIALSMGSPFAGTAAAGFLLLMGQGWFDQALAGWTGTLGWTLGHWGIAVGLFNASVNSADARLGRMPEKTNPPRRPLAVPPAPRGALPAQSARE